MKTLLEQLTEIFEGEWDQPLDKPAIPVKRLTPAEWEAQKVAKKIAQKEKEKQVCLTGGYRNGVKGFPKYRHTKETAMAREVATASLQKAYICPYCGFWHTTHLGNDRNVSRY